MLSTIDAINLAFQLTELGFAKSAILSLLASQEKSAAAPAPAKPKKAKLPAAKPKGRRAPRGSIWSSVAALLPASKADILDKMGSDRASAAAIIARKLKRGAIVGGEGGKLQLADPQRPGK
jgi:hypothetical protein